MILNGFLTTAPGLNTRQDKMKKALECGNPSAGDRRLACLQQPYFQSSVGRVWTLALQELDCQLPNLLNYSIDLRICQAEMGISAQDFAIIRKGQL